MTAHRRDKVKWNKVKWNVGPSVSAMAVVLLWTSSAWCGQPAKDANADREVVSAEVVARLVRELGSPEFRTRETATARLKKCGVEAVEPLKEAALVGELEVAIRAISVLEELALDEDENTADTSTAALMRLKNSANSSVSWRSARALRVVRDWAALAIESLGGHVSVETGSDGKSIAQIKLDGVPGGKLNRLQQRALRQYEVLVIAGGKVDDDDVAFLSELRDLRHLDLRYTRIGDAGLAHLKNLSQLRKLMLSGTRLSDDGLTVLPRLEELRVVYLSSTGVSDRGLAHLAQLEHLEEINLSQCKGVTDSGMNALRKSKSLTQLNLTGTRVGDAGLKTLAAMPQLKELYLHGTLVTEQGVKQLRTSLPDCRVRH
ncbi:MAG: hypothetical protein RIC55_28505 [Pirellulaceae bacterium]